MKLVGLDPDNKPRSLVFNAAGELLVNSTGDDMGPLPVGATLAQTLHVDADGNVLTAEE